MDYGVCDICGEPVAAGSSFVNTEPTDRKDPSKPKRRSWVAVDVDIHGWSPFVLTHPVCFAEREGVAALVSIVDDSHRLMRRRLSNQ